MMRALTIAQYIINYCFRKRTLISNPQLQKILYFIQKECLRNTGKPAFYDDIVAWKLGPVIVEVNSEFASYAGRPILRDFPEVIIDNKQLRDVIDEVIEAKMNISASSLMEETNASGQAWDRVYRCGAGRNKIIPTSLIKEDITAYT